MPSITSSVSISSSSSSRVVVIVVVEEVVVVVARQLPYLMPGIAMLQAASSGGWEAL